jgi:serine phosphatase RsbU (regulator of sigma subunit)
VAHDADRAASTRIVAETQLESGDLLVIFTDGIIEAMDGRFDDDQRKA